MVLPPRVAGRLEEQLRAEFEAAKGALGTDFEAFRASKLKELPRPVSRRSDYPRNKKDEAKKGGQALGESFTKGAAAELKKLDAVALGSAEAMSHASTTIMRCCKGAARQLQLAACRRREHGLPTPLMCGWL